MIRTTEDVSIELGQRLHASPQRDGIAPKETMPEEAAPVRVHSSLKVLPCLAFAAKHNTVKNKHMEVIKTMHKQVDSNSFSLLAAVLALMSIECENFQLIAAGTPFESLLGIVLLFSLAVFGMEFLVRCVAEEDYCCTAWFPLDLLATLTLLMEMRWFQELAFNEGCTMMSPSSDHYAHVSGQAAHALRVARVLRILRFARLIKLCRLGCGLLACSGEWLPWLVRNFQFFLDIMIPVHDSVATEKPVAEDEWFQGVFQV